MVAERYHITFHELPTEINVLLREMFLKHGRFDKRFHFLLEKGAKIEDISGGVNKLLEDVYCFDFAFDYDSSEWLKENYGATIDDISVLKRIIDIARDAQNSILAARMAKYCEERADGIPILNQILDIACDTRDLVLAKQMVKQGAFLRSCTNAMRMFEIMFFERCARELDENRWVSFYLENGLTFNSFPGGIGSVLKTTLLLGKDITYDNYGFRVDSPSFDRRLKILFGPMLFVCRKQS